MTGVSGKPVGPISRVKRSKKSAGNIKSVVIQGTNERVAKTIYKWKPYATRPKGRPRVRWEDDVRNDLRKMWVTNWKQRTQERKQWKEIIEQAKTHKEL